MIYRISSELKLKFRGFQIYHYITLVMAVALQIQVTLFTRGDYYGLRVSVADLLLPLCGFLVLYSLLKGKTKFPHWSLPFTWLWLLALSVVMSIALVNGYIQNGFLSSWAFINKYVGFYLLLSYFMLGGWLVTNGKDNIIALFVNVFVGFFVLTIAMSLIFLFLQPLRPDKLFWLSHYSWDGFMANRNAFMVVFISAFILIVWSYSPTGVHIPSWIKSLFWLCILTFLLFNGSRTGWILSSIIVPVVFFKNPIERAKKIIPLIILSAAIVYASFYVTKETVITDRLQMDRLKNAISESADDVNKNDKKRYISLDDGLELYQQSSPILGSGLGTYKTFQIEKRGEFIEIIDFTALWLLVETGGLGLFAFSAFFIACAYRLYRTGYKDGANPYHRAMLLFILVFAVMSLLHELMYTRFLWFALGIALASVAKFSGNTVLRQHK